jgi:hypothetical protein
MKLLWALGVVVSSLFGWVAYMAADIQPPYVYDAAGSYIVPAIADDGDQITVKWKLKQVNRICPGSNRRYLFEKKTGIILASYDPMPAAADAAIKDGYLNRTFLLPRGLLPSGEIGYRATVCYECNPLQKFVKPLCLTTPDISFWIR